MNFKRIKNTRLFSALGGLLIACVMTVGASAQVTADWFVDGSSGDDSADGDLWSTAYKTVQKALGAAVDGDIIFVAAGTYYPDEINGGDSNLRSDSFDLVNQVKLYGGFLNGDVFADRDPETNITILTGDIDKDGVPQDSDNSWHVVTADGVGATTLLNGFTISDGHAKSGGMDDNGAGILILDSSLLIVRCTLTRNDAVRGGGIYVDVTGTAAPTFFNCSIIKNSAHEGSGMRLEGDPELILVVNCLIAKSALFGGAIYANGPDVDIINCTFHQNDISGCSTGHITSNNGSQITITNSIITQPDHGPNFGVDVATGSLITVSFSNVVGGLYLTEDFCPPISALHVIDGGGNIDADPMFCAPYPNSNYRLQDGSPCINTASNAALPNDIADVDDDPTNNGDPVPWDLDKRLRVFPATSGTVDMGAYENQHDELCPADFNDDCLVSASDLLSLLANWGSCPGCPADLDCDLVVGASDLLILLADWGRCCGAGPEPPSLQDELDDACLTAAHWADFLDKMQNGTPAEQENYICWLTHYFEDCTRCICIGASGCPGADPFDD